MSYLSFYPSWHEVYNVFSLRGIQYLLTDVGNRASEGYVENNICEKSIMASALDSEAYSIINRLGGAA